MNTTTNTNTEPAADINATLHAMALAEDRPTLTDDLAAEIARVGLVYDWTLYTSVKAEAKAEALARGIYQRGLSWGTEAVSGSTLKGNMKKFSIKYRQSALSWISRLRSNGLWVAEFRRGRRIVLVIGEV